MNLNETHPSLAGTDECTGDSYAIPDWAIQKHTVDKQVLKEIIEKFFLNVNHIGPDGKITMSKEYFTEFMGALGLTEKGSKTKVTTKETE